MSQHSKSHQDIRVPWYSSNHPMIPRFYIQPWTQDIVNRPIITQNAKAGNIPNFEHDDSTYLNKREQLKYNMQDRALIDRRTTKIPTRAQMMVSKPWETRKRYDSGMMARYAKVETVELVQK